MIGFLLAKLRAAAVRDKPQHQRDAARGEDLAYNFLRRRGYRIIARNVETASRQGEIDLIGWDGEHLAFVEVRTRRDVEFGRPEESVGREKQQNIIRAAHEYIRRAKVAPNRMRYDIVSVILTNPPEIDLYKSAFVEPGENAFG